jgi:hypothetical protein
MGIAVETRDAVQPYDSGGCEPNTTTHIALLVLTSSLAVAVFAAGDNNGKVHLACYLPGEPL